jgi:hypothetical protein
MASPGRRPLFTESKQVKEWLARELNLRTEGEGFWLRIQDPVPDGTYRIPIGSSLTPTEVIIDGGKIRIGEPCGDPANREWESRDKEIRQKLSPPLKRLRLVTVLTPPEFVDRLVAVFRKRGYEVDRDLLQHAYERWVDHAVDRPGFKDPDRMSDGDLYWALRDRFEEVPDDR